MNPASQPPFSCGGALPFPNGEANHIAACCVPSLTILTHDPRWRGKLRGLRAAAQAALVAEAATGAVTLVLADDAGVQTLNRAYRGKDRPTNVLSFPNGEEDEGVILLGDIILAYETVAAEARAQGKEFSAHAAHLVVHGVLHLLGYDHEIEAEAEAMEAREVMILAQLAIANPYLPH